MILGLEQEIQGMCIGEIRRLIVPAALHVCKFQIITIEKSPVGCVCTTINQVIF